jgi:L-ascorbate metabolism protein UlaG (beta-lactamase superfamily)
MKNKISRLFELAQSFVRSLPMSLTSKESKKYFGAVKLSDWFISLKSVDSSINPLITWIGHSSFLIQINGFNILVDPIFEDLMFLYKRNFPPGISFNDLPKIDFILISHNHGDHFDKKTILKLKKHNPKILIPKGLSCWFLKNGFKDVHENEWWQSYKVNKDLKIDFLPAVHWSGQSLLDINKSIWGSWMISTADTAYGDHFRQIAEKYDSIDLALMPISPCKPREFVRESHIDAQEAITAFLELKAKRFVPMHWGTFRINLDQFDEPVQLLKKSWKQNSNYLKNKKLHVLKFGERLEI